MIAWLAAWFARSTLGRWIVGALAIVVGVSLYLARRDRAVVRRANDARELQTLRRDAATRERMDHADVGRADPDDDLRWLIRRSEGLRARR